MSRENPSTKDILRVGKVSAVFPERCTATVEFKMRDGLVTKELAIMQGNTLKNRDYRLVDVGEHVACAFYGDGASEGLILGCIYDRKNDNDTNAQDVRRLTFDDGADIRYDRAEHKLTAYIPGDAEITLDKSLTAKVGEDISAEVGGDVTVTASKVTINASSISLSAGGGGGTATLSGHFTMVGNLSVTGNVSASGSIIDAGGNTNHHSH